MIRIGQIGIGHNHGSAKMECVRKFPEVFEVVGFTEDDPHWLAERGNWDCYQGIPRLTEEELLSRCDAVMIEPDVPHLTEVARRCIDAGKHIHMDKPGSGTLAEFKALLDEAEKKKLVLQMAYMYRYNPAVKKCLEMVRGGELGEIYSVNAEMSTGHEEWYRKWLTRFDGGIMYILGSHLIDLALLILGEPEKITSIFLHSKKGGIDFPDNDLAVLEYEKAMARIYVSSVEVNGWFRRNLVVSGSKGTLAIQPMENIPGSVHYTDQSMVESPYADFHTVLDLPLLTGPCRYDEMMLEFAACVRGEMENPYSYAHEYLLQKVLTQVIEKGTKK